MDYGFINFSKNDLQTEEGIAQLNRILNLLAINLPGDSENIRIYSGYGTPESVVTAGIGSIYMRADGSSDTSVYRKESGTGNTGWVAVSNVALPLAVASGGTGQNFSGELQGEIPYFSATGVMSSLATGTSGKFLKTQGAGANPIWADSGVTYTDGTLTEGSASTQRDTISSSFVNLKEFTPLIRGGTISVQWDCARSGGNNAHSRVYVNDIAVGADKTVAAGAPTFETETETGVTVVAGDVVQIYGYNEGGIQTTSIKNAKILVARPSYPSEASGF